MVLALLEAFMISKEQKDLSIIPHLLSSQSKKLQFLLKVST